MTTPSQSRGPRTSESQRLARLAGSLTRWGRSIWDSPTVRGFTGRFPQVSGRGSGLEARSPDHTGRELAREQLQQSAAREAFNRRNDFTDEQGYNPNPSLPPSYNSIPDASGHSPSGNFRDDTSPNAGNEDLPDTSNSSDYFRDDESMFAISSGNTSYDLDSEATSIDDDIPATQLVVEAASATSNGGSTRDPLDDLDDDIYATQSEASSIDGGHDLRFAQVAQGIAAQRALGGDNPDIMDPGYFELLMGRLHADALGHQENDDLPGTSNSSLGGEASSVADRRAEVRAELLRRQPDADASRHHENDGRGRD
jgi:hypothetical protein